MPERKKLERIHFQRVMLFTDRSSQSRQNDVPCHVRMDFLHRRQICIENEIMRKCNFLRTRDSKDQLQKLNVNKSHSTPKLFLYREPDCIPKPFKLLFSLDIHSQDAYYQEAQSKFILFYSSFSSGQELVFMRFCSFMLTPASPWLVLAHTERYSKAQGSYLRRVLWGDIGLLIAKQPVKKVL